MALEAETGTGSATSESYAAVADADQYLADRGYTLWATITTAQKEQALRRASAYMEQVYREQWAGYRVNTTQALSWPRYEVPIKDSASMNYGGLSYYQSDAVPVIVANACAELAFRAAAGELAPDVGRVTTRERVDTIEVEYAPGSLPYVRYRAIDLALAPFLKGRAGSVMVVRA